MNKIRTQKRFASHVGQHPAAGAVKPVNRSLCRIFAHPFYLVVESPAIMAIEIAFELSEEIGNQRGN